MVSLFPLYVLALALAASTAGLVTLQTIIEVTDVIRDATAAITGPVGLLRLGESGGVGPGLGGAQIGLGAVARDNDDDDGEGNVEDVVAAALVMVNRKILEALNVPLDGHVEPPEPKPSCPVIIEQYHSLLASTTWLLRSVQDKQLANRWDGRSPVFDALSWMQALWASRKPNEQNRSFIEQQSMLYSSIGCSNDVIRRGSEIVEYMNDLIDSF